MFQNFLIRHEFFIASNNMRAYVYLIVMKFTIINHLPGLLTRFHILNSIEIEKIVLCWNVKINALSKKLTDLVYISCITFKIMWTIFINRFPLNKRWNICLENWNLNKETINRINLIVFNLTKCMIYSIMILCGLTIILSFRTKRKPCNEIC